MILRINFSATKKAKYGEQQQAFEHESKLK